MALKTFSKFYYGHTITVENQIIVFKEDGDVLNRVNTLNVGGYTLQGFCVEVERALNEIGGQEYNCNVDRETRIITVFAQNNFELVVTDPDYQEISCYDLLGFSTDQVGSNLYQAGFASGLEYKPQFILQKYVDFKDDQRANESKLNQSASGVTEVVSYGKIKTMSCNIMYITDLNQLSDSPVESNPNGVADYRQFVDYLTTKAPIEFMNDRDNTSFFEDCFLESSKKSRDGIGFTIYEMYSKKLIGYFESKVLKFRKLE